MLIGAGIRKVKVLSSYNFKGDTRKKYRTLLKVYEFDIFINVFF